MAASSLALNMNWTGPVISDGGKSLASAGTNDIVIDGDTATQTHTFMLTYANGDDRLAAGDSARVWYCGDQCWMGSFYLESGYHVAELLGYSKS